MRAPAEFDKRVLRALIDRPGHLPEIIAALGENPERDISKRCQLSLQVLSDLKLVTAEPDTSGVLYAATPRAPSALGAQPVAKSRRLRIKNLHPGRPPKTREPETPLQWRAAELASQHGSIRKAAAAIGIDHQYLQRIYNGQVLHPDDRILVRLGMLRTITYTKILEP